MGVLINFGTAANVNGAGGALITRRNAVIADDSGYTVVVGFWANFAAEFDDVKRG